jgi:glyoxylase-like metal-dependent hydrolase (beta-lactamase superfamily II)
VSSFICETCGTQYPPAAQPPAECVICADVRQYVGLLGQKWITVEELRRTRGNFFDEEEPRLTSFHTQVHFGIGQRAFVLETPRGNVLWDCVSLLDDNTFYNVCGLGGVDAIAISHPHYYTSMVDWSIRFRNVPIYLHEADREWVMRPHPNIKFWSGESMKLFEDLTLIHTPGHFAGYQVLHWPAGADGRGVLLSGDQPQVCSDPRWVSFMYSYPNYIPMGRRAIEDIVARLAPYEFERIYGAFPRRSVKADAKGVLARSVERYLKAIAE